MEKVKVENIEKIKDILKFTNYNENLGGQWIYTPYMDFYKRNKRDIKRYIKYNDRYFEVYEIIKYFYNKAIIYKEIEKENYILLSYETIVAEYNKNKMILHGYYSKTTANHINFFLHKFNKKTMGKKEIEKMIDIEF